MEKQRKILSFISMLVACAVLVPMTALSASASGALMGDVNFNGELEAYDALAIQRYSIGLDEFSPDQEAVADVNHDECIDIIDAISVLRASIGLENLGEADVSPTKSELKTKETSKEDYAAEVLRLVNIERQKKGLTALALDDKLGKISDVRAREICDVFDHKRPSGEKWSVLLKEYNAPYHTAAENIAAGYATPEDVVKGWMSSDGHRANILNPNYSKMGLGYYYVQNDMYQHYWEQIFTD